MTAKDARLRNQLKAVRLRLGLSQQEIADAAGVTRQTIGGIEADLYSPSASVALKLARALGCPVDELFWLDSSDQSIAASAAEGETILPGGRVTLSRIGGRWVAHSLAGAAAYRWEMIPAGGVCEAAGEDGGIVVRLLDDAATLERTIVLAGCTPALSLWARSAERWHPGMRVSWRHQNSTDSLLALVRGEVHGAGVHLCDAESGDQNLQFIRRLVPGVPLTLVNLGIWSEGFLTAPGNPLGIRTIDDLGKRVTMVNREQGAGSRILFDSLLKRSGIVGANVRGYDRIVSSHEAVAAAVAEGLADVGIGTAAVADIYGLEFIALQRVRFDLAFSTSTLEFEPVRQLVSTLQHRWIRSQLDVLAGLDTSSTGEQIVV